jgi:hypothetical protein
MGVNTLDKISDLLPEGLDEGTLGKIADLIAKKINEEVKAEVGKLTTKVTSFIRGNIEKLKEQSIKELELENETFRNAQMYETVRSMFAIENTQDDEINGINALASIGESQEKQIGVLTAELDKVIRENVRLHKANNLISKNNDQLKESLQSLQERKPAVVAKGKSMSDSAIVVSSETFQKKEPKINESKQVPGVRNEWLSESVLEASNKLNITK